MPATPRSTSLSIIWICRSRSSSRLGPFQNVSQLHVFAIFAASKCADSQTSCAVVAGMTAITGRPARRQPRSPAQRSKSVARGSKRPDDGRSIMTRLVCHARGSSSACDSCPIAF